MSKDRYEELSQKEQLTLEEFKELGHYQLAEAMRDIRVAC